MEKSIQDYIDELMSLKSRSTTPIESVQGDLIVEVTHSRGTFPIEKATVKIFDSSDKELATMLTDQSGRTFPISLDAKSKSLTESPGSSSSKAATLYNIKIFADGFVTTTIKNIPIYEGVTTLQNYDMLFSSVANGKEEQTIVLDNNNNL